MRRVRGRLADWHSWYSKLADKQLSWHRSLVCSISERWKTVTILIFLHMQFWRSIPLFIFCTFCGIHITALLQNKSLINIYFIVLKEQKIADEREWYSVKGLDPTVRLWGGGGEGGGPEKAEWDGLRNGCLALPWLRPLPASLRPPTVYTVHTSPKPPKPFHMKCYTMQPWNSLCDTKKNTKEVIIQRWNELESK